MDDLMFTGTTWGDDMCSQSCSRSIVGTEFYLLTMVAEALAHEIGHK